MDIKVKLEDESVCAGCPLDSQETKACKGGFIRTTARIVEYQAHYGFGQRGPALASIPMRPLECLLANERALNVLERLPVKTPAAKTPAPIKLTPPPPRARPEADHG